MKNKNDHKQGSEKKNYKRDTILMICALVVLFLSPVGISVYSNYQQEKMMEEYTAQIMESMAEQAAASASDATASDISWEVIGGDEE